MRRLVLLFLMLVLPLQWSWAAAAGFCEHEPAAQAGHFGHHAHAHPGAAQAADSADTETRAPGSHPDCGVCNGWSAPVLPSLGSALAAGFVSVAFVHYVSAVPDREADTPLRPPMPLVA